MAESYEAQFVGPNTKTGRQILEERWGEPWRNWLDCLLRVDPETARTEPGHEVHVRAVSTTGGEAMVPLRWIIGLPMDARERAHLVAFNGYPAGTAILCRLQLRRGTLNEQ